MTDKDILISDLNDISEILNNNGYVGWCKAIRKAVALLKEQEAVEPKHNPLSPTDWFCGKCGMCISRFHDYCPSCGQETKWNGD